MGIYGIVEYKCGRSKETRYGEKNTKLEEKVQVVMPTIYLTLIMNKVNVETYYKNKKQIERLVDQF